MWPLSVLTSLLENPWTGYPRYTCQNLSCQQHPIGNEGTASGNNNPPYSPPPPVPSVSFPANPAPPNVSPIPSKTVVPVEFFVNNLGILLHLYNVKCD